MNFGDKSYKLIDLKNALMSNNNQIQIEAAMAIVKLLSAENNYQKEYYAKVLISVDIIEVLCETMSTMSHQLIQLCYKCCELLMVSPKYMDRRHLNHLISAITNSVTVVSSSDNYLLIASGLILLNNILSRVSKTSLLLSFRLESMYRLLGDLSETRLDRELIVPVISLFNRLLTDGESIKHLDIIEKLLPCIVKAISNNRDLQLVRFISRTILNLHVLIKQVNEKRDLECLYSIIYEISTDLILPFFLVTDSDNFCKSFSVIADSLIVLLCDGTHQIANKLSMYFLRNGCLASLTKLQQNAMVGSCQKKYEKVIELLLVEGCKNELGVQHAWDDLLSKGIVCLMPPLWTFGFHQSLQANLTVLVYYYFSYLVSSESIVKACAFRDLCTFITRLKTSSDDMTPAIKPLWLVYAHLYLHERHVTFDCKKASKTISILLSESDMQSVYTHHPAILYWTFADVSVPYSLKKNVICQWIENMDGISFQVLSLLANADENVRSCLIDITKEGNCKTSFEGARTLIDLDTSLKQDLAEQIWAQLPALLATCRLNNLWNVTNLTALCLEYTFDELDIERVVRFLPGCIVRNMSENQSSDFTQNVFDFLLIISRLVTLILEQSLHLNKPDGCMSLINHELFLIKLNNLISSTKDTELIPTLVDCISQMLLCQNQFNIKSDTKIKLNSDNIVSILRSNCTHAVSALIRMLNIYLESKMKRKDLVLLEIIFKDKNQMEYIYVMIHQLCYKNLGESGSEFWKCLKSILESCGDMPELQSTLAGSPWTDLLISYALSPEDPSFPHAVEFIQFWLPLANMSSLESCVKTLSQIPSHPLLLKLYKNVLSLTNISKKLKSIVNKKLEQEDIRIDENNHNIRQYNNNNRSQIMTIVID